ncbi:hypothetical protein FBU31_000327 [Coemansia sp. 'formosensis']|nr:hypothetical protein FBU31_000327 [Coemansia sp. 'formosensis']
MGDTLKMTSEGNTVPAVAEPSQTVVFTNGSSSVLGSHQKLVTGATDAEVMDWVQIVARNMRLGAATFNQVVNLLDNNVGADYNCWCEWHGHATTWETLKKYIMEVHHGGNSQWSLSYDLHNLRADMPIKEFNERFHSLSRSLNIEDMEMAKGLYHAKMPTALHKVIRLLKKDTTLQAIMDIVDDKVQAYLESTKGSAMDVDAIGYGGFLPDTKGITIAGSSKTKSADVAVTGTAKYLPCSGFDAMIACLVKSGLSEAVVCQCAEAGTCLHCGDSGHKLAACPSNPGKAQ